MMWYTSKSSNLRGGEHIFQNAVTSRILGVERTVWFQCKVSASTLFPEPFSYFPKPIRLSSEVKFVPSVDVDWRINASHLTSISDHAITLHVVFKTPSRQHFTFVFSPQPPQVAAGLRSSHRLRSKQSEPPTCSQY